MIWNCEERYRLGEKVAEAIRAVFALRDEERDPKRNKDEFLPVRIAQARSAQRMAELALQLHNESHGCGPEDKTDKSTKR